MTRGERIAAARAHAGLSRAQLGQRCSPDPEKVVDPRQVFRWEREDVEPRSDVLLRLADALSVSVRWLITGDDPPTWFESESLAPTGS